MSRIYLLLRKLVFFCWRWITVNEMEEIAAYYHYGVRISLSSFFPMHPLLKGVRLIGQCRYKERILLVSSEEPKVFWHELGHGVSPRLFQYGGRRIIFWTISEIVATIFGFYLNTKWRRRLKGRRLGKSSRKTSFLSHELDIACPTF